MRSALLRVLLTVSAVMALVLAGLGAPVTASAANTIAPNQTLASGQSLTSQNGAYSLQMQPDGNAVVYAAQGRVLWHSHTFGNAGARLIFQGDGNLVVYSSAGRALWNAGTWGNPGARIYLQDDGNLVVYRANGTPAWFSGPDRTPDYPPATGNIMYAAQQLAAGQSIRSGNGQYALVMQTDGNAVAYATGSRPLWSSATWGNPGARLVFQSDGNLVVYAADGRALWHTSTFGNPGSRVSMQDDGNVVVYRSNSTPAWNAGPDRHGLPLLVNTGSSTQVVTVVAPSATSTVAQLTAWERRGDGWVAVLGPTTARLGSAGMGQASESSTRTPAGTFTLTEAFGRQGNPGTALPYRVVDGNDWWVSDVNSSLYNRYARCAPGTCPFNEAAGENLYAPGAVYDNAVVIDYNRGGTPGAGSAFFLHITNGAATAGCVAIDRAALATVMRWLNPAASPLIAIGVG